MLKDNDDWLSETLESYHIDPNLTNEEITAELKKIIADLKKLLSENNKQSSLTSKRKFSRKKSSDEDWKKRKEIWQEIDKINEIIIMTEGRIEIDPNKNEENNSADGDSIMQKRTARIREMLLHNERSKTGLENLLRQFRDKNSKEMKETKQMLQDVCIKIEVLKMQLNFFDIIKKTTESGNSPEVFYLHKLKTQLKVELAVIDGSNKAMEALSKDPKAKKSCRAVSEAQSVSAQKVTLLKISINKLMTELSQGENSEMFLDNELLFDKISPKSIKAKVFPITGTINMSITKCEELISKEDLKKSKTSKSTKIYIDVLVDNIVFFTTQPITTGEHYSDITGSFKIFKGKEFQIQVYYQSGLMCGINYMLLENLIDEKPRKIVLDLAPQGKLFLTIGFLNPLIDNPAKLKRNNAIPKRFNMTGPSRLGVELPIWGAIMKNKTLEEISNKSSQTSMETSSSIDDFVLLKILGAGNFGQVILCKDNSDGVYAMKLQLKSEILSRGEIDTLRVEMNVLRYAAETKNNFLVNLVACFTTACHVCFVMEFVGGGDLMARIQKSPFSHSQSVFYAACVLLGLRHLHQLDILYRDLKLDNVMLCSDGYAKITDFGLCKEKMPFEATTYTFCGTPEFISPEMLSCSCYTRAIDWWQFGVFIYEMITVQPPFYGDDDEELFSSIIHDQPDLNIIKRGASRDIVSSLLVKNPEKRLGNSLEDANDIMKHSFFSSMNFFDLESKSIKPPVKPKMSSEIDTSNFEPEFTSRKPEFPSGSSDFLEEDNDVFAYFKY